MSTTTNMGIELIDGSDYISPDPINNGFTKLDALGVDYITEYGTSGEWWYRKWNSGRAECGIESKSFGSNTLTQWISLYSTYKEYTFGAYPFAFIAKPCAIISNLNKSWLWPCTIDSTNPLTLSPKFDMISGRQYTIDDLICGIYVTGRYK